MKQSEQPLEDYLAKLNIEGSRDTWQKRRRHLDFVVGKIHRYLNNVRRVCDIGLGDGYLLRRFKAMGLEVTGIDISEYLIGHLSESFKKEALEITLIHGDISKVNVSKDSFDIVTCLDVLEHIPGDSLQTAIGNLKEWLTDGGLLVATLPFGENLDSNMVVCPKCRHIFHRIGHFHSFDSWEQIRSLLQPDFEIIKAGYAPFATFKLSLLNRVSYWVFHFLCRLAGLRKARTAYFIAKLNKP